MKFKAIVITSIILFGLASCNNENSCKFDIIVPVENYDTLKPGETYIAELRIPDFDSTLYYQCIVGEYDTINDSSKCKLDLNKEKTYTLLYQPENFNENGSYLIVSIKQKVGQHFYQGFIKSKDDLGNENYFTFKCDYFVED
jgi:hypothetical protein